MRAAGGGNQSRMVVAQGLGGVFVANKTTGNEMAILLGKYPPPPPFFLKKKGGGRFVVK